MATVLPVANAGLRPWVVAAAVGMLAAATLGPGTAMAANYNNTNPGATPCGQAGAVTYRLGLRTNQNPQGSEAISTPIMYSHIVIGEVEIRHSALCGTVWAKVWNRTAGTVRAREALVTYTNPNGAGRNERWYPTADSLAPGQAGWSNQFYDTPSFSARGCITYAGVEWCAETARAASWVQNSHSYPNYPWYPPDTTTYPFSCTGQGNFACHRWRTAAMGVSATAYYRLDSSITDMPCGSSTCDIRATVRTTFEKFNAIPYPIPFFRETSSGNVISVVGTFSNMSDINNVAETHTYINSSGYIYQSIIQLNKNMEWGNSGNNVGTLCHETDHVLGLGHVWYHQAFAPYVDDVGSKATCIGRTITTGPSLDDTMAFKSIYSSVYP